ncbi:hypothetical protein RS030_203076 [Cryptosporidium xiaoi]|uniref:Ubiquitin-like protein ATG12 n=1 Tax=Cryptosporidium xiaoi TaxID=659607 RepID=A0AAV9Y047_9CRYT
MNLLDRLSESLDDKRNFRVPIIFRPLGKTPLLEKSEMYFNGREKISFVSEFIRSELNVEGNVYLYINNCLEPNKDECIFDLYLILNREQKLYISYSLKPLFL